MIRNWRFWTGVGMGAFVAILLVASVSLALAQGPNPETPPAVCPGLADADGDGVCDNFIDEDGDGVRDLRGSDWGPGRGRGFADIDADGVCDKFVDEDGDGVCDRYRQAPGMGHGRSGGYGNRSYAGQGGCWR